MVDTTRDDPMRSALFTDLYELTMAQAYDAQGMGQTAVFELFFRQMPSDRNYMMAAGLNDVLGYLENLRFTEDDLAYLRDSGQYTQAFLDRLGDLRFTGDVYGVPEGSIVFPNEPLVQVVAPIIEAQLVETLVLNQVHFQTVVATKAARVVTAAAGRTVIDFGSRRAHGCDAALKVARTGYIAGAAGTSNVLAGKVYGIPVFGTMAHSYVQAHDDESEALACFARLYPQTTLLVDTYNTLGGVQKVIALAGRLGADFKVRAIRLDSGDLTALATRSRQMLDEAGLTGVGIFASSGLDEYEIARLVRGGVPIDGFGVGSKLAVADDAPYLDMAYKLVEYAGQPRTKRSPDKVIHPGRKQVYRIIQDGTMVGDVIGHWAEDLKGQRLLQPVMQHGRRLKAGRVSLGGARQHAASALAQLPDAVRGLERLDKPYSVRFSAAQQDMALATRPV